METQEQILKEQRLRIEVLRHRLLLRYYELLLSLDVLTQAAEVKTLMGYINTLERYAKRFENKPSKKEAGKKGRKNTADETTADDIHPEASISLSGFQEVIDVGRQFVFFRWQIVVKIHHIEEFLCVFG